MYSISKNNKYKIIRNILWKNIDYNISKVEDTYCINLFKPYVFLINVKRVCCYYIVDFRANDYSAQK